MTHSSIQCTDIQTDGLCLLNSKTFLFFLPFVPLPPPSPFDSKWRPERNGNRREICFLFRILFWILNSALYCLRIQDQGEICLGSQNVPPWTGLGAREVILKKIPKLFSLTDSDRHRCGVRLAAATPFDAIAVPCHFTGSIFQSAAVGARNIHTLVGTAYSWISMELSTFPPSPLFNCHRQTQPCKGMSPLDDSE